MKRSSFKKPTPEKVKELNEKKRLKMLSKPKTRKVSSRTTKTSQKGKSSSSRAKKQEMKRKLCEQYDLPILPCSRWGTGKAPTRTDLLKGMLWTVFSAYIRNRDYSKDCITCNQPLLGNLQAGHYVPVGNSSIALWFREDNVHGEHPTCNADFQGWHLVPMRKNLVRLYGEERVAELDALAGKKDTVKWDEPVFVEKIKHYKALI